MKTVDVGAMLDEGPWSGYQKLLVFGTALAIILDGFDNQLLPNAVPALVSEWGRSRGEFTSALALGPFGMMIGGLLGGVLGDRFGRRTALLSSVVSFAVFTLAISFINSIEMLGALRFLAGVGLGGAMPNAATLASEYVPRRRRPFAVTLTIVCIPLGGVVAAEIAARVIPAYGWHALFILGGTAPILLAVVLSQILPESPKFLARYRERWPDLTKTMRRMRHAVPDEVVYAERGTEGVPAKPASIASLFSGGLASDSVALGASFFFCLMVNYVIILLLPAMLAGPNVGFSQPAASRALAMSNYGGVAGAILGALVIQRLGSRVTMLAMSAAAVASPLVLANTRLDPSSTFFLMTMILLTGGLLNAVQTTMYALAAHIYPTDIRSTGIGTAVAVGRVGNVLAAYVGSFAIDRGGPTGYFTTVGGLMVLVLISLASIRRHVPPASQAVLATSQH
jgi:AAHS family 4-hydroxybenzoate transporter-like MFS transporter